MKKKIQVIGSIIVTLLLGYILIKQVNFTDLSTLSTLANPRIIIIGFLIYFTMNCARITRLKLLFPKQRTGYLTSIVFVHNFMNNLLPFRAGELSYIYLLKKKENVHRVIVSLALMRFLDLAMIIIFTLGAFFAMGSTIEESFRNGVIGFGIALMGILCAGVILRKTKWKNSHLLNFQEAIRSFSGGAIASAAITSAVIMYLSILLYQYVSWELGIPVGFFPITIAVALVILGSILPFSGIAGFGVMEGTWAVGLLLFGIDKETAIVSGFIIHVLRIYYFIILGGIGFLLKSTWKEKKIGSSKEVEKYTTYYQDEEQVEYYQNILENVMAKAIEENKKQKFRKVLKKYFNKAPKEYLDIACGYGRMTSFFENIVENATGIDVAQEMLNVAKKRCKKTTFLRKNLLEEKWNKKFDLITTFRYFVNAKEEEKKKMIQAIRKLCKRNTVFIFNIHKNKTLQVRLFTLIQKIVHGKTVNMMGRKEVEELIKENFTIKETLGNDYGGFAKWTSIKNKTIAEIIATVDNWCDKLFPSNWATNVVYICVPKEKEEEKEEEVQRKRQRK